MSLDVTAPPYFRGEWLVEGDPGYDERRAHFNKRYDRRPALIARCAGVQDVRAALRFAREQGWEVSVRGGGRSPGGYSTIERGLLLDLSLMNDVYVDPDRRTARVGPGATQAEVLRETVPFGLAPVTGALSHIGFVGVAIFSGTGHLSPRHGYSCDWVLSAQVVLADGEVVTASPTSHPDLFWAIRGAGDNFGVVVSVETQLHAVPETATLGMWSWRVDGADAATELMRRYGELERGVSTDVFMMGDFAADGDGRLAFDLIYAHIGDDVEAARDIAVIDTFGTPIDRSVSDVDWVTLHHAADESFPSSRQYWSAADLAAMDDVSVDLIIDEALRMPKAAPGANLVLAFYEYRGAMLRQVAAPPAAMSRRSGCELIAITMSDDPDLDEACEAWAKGLVDRFRDAGLVHAGAMPNYTTRVEARDVWGADYERLAQLKRQYDPDNVFRHNVNIQPAR